MFKKNEEVKEPVTSKSDQKPNLKEVTKVKKGPTQREIVYARVCEVVKSEKIIVKSGQAVQECLTSEQLAKIQSLVVVDFKSGKAKLKDTPANKEKLSDDAKLKTYVIGLCSNWLRRDPLLNGDKPFNG